MPAQRIVHPSHLMILPEVTSAPGSTAAEVLSAAGTGTAGPWETATPLAASLGARECTANSTSAASCRHTHHISGDRGAALQHGLQSAFQLAGSSPWLDRSARRCAQSRQATEASVVINPPCACTNCQNMLVVCQAAGDPAASTSNCCILCCSLQAAHAS